ncbi:hypothetical protein FC99_GL000855 [Levilactobacillus koreensis JCM 16448]|nr:hypothetical protein FC99_GL000855 [Levilactobacillus koreensis JCM 16448]
MIVLFIFLRARKDRFNNRLANSQLNDFSINRYTLNLHMPGTVLIADQKRIKHDKLSKTVHITFESL